MSFELKLRTLPPDRPMVLFVVCTGGFCELFMITNVWPIILLASLASAQTPRMLQGSSEEWYPYLGLSSQYVFSRIHLDVSRGILRREKVCLAGA